MEGGTHGQIKCYQFPVPKSRLEEVVRNIIRNDSMVIQDPNKGYYNDDTMYVRVKIMEDSLISEYIFHYYGDKNYWMSSRTSIISISYACDNERNGGSSGNGDVKWYDFSLRNELTDVFERGLILKIDKEIGATHTKCTY